MIFIVMSMFRKYVAAAKKANIVKRVLASTTGGQQSPCPLSDPTNGSSEYFLPCRNETEVSADKRNNYISCNSWPQLQTSNYF